VNKLTGIAIHEISLSEVLPKLPEITQVSESDFNNREDVLFLCALGFEDRCTTIPKFIAENTKYKCKESIYFEYSTNPEDNEINREDLVSALDRFSSIVNSVQCDSENFSEMLRAILKRIALEYKVSNITFDISVCSSKLLLTVLKILFEFNVNLQIVYTEAEIYHPTQEEAKLNLDKWIREEAVGLTIGVSAVFTLKEYCGKNIDDLPHALVAFLTFKPERIKKAIFYVDETLLNDPKRIFWIIGKPHLSENKWRIQLVKEINKEMIDQLEGSPIYVLSTFNYKDILKKLYEIYETYSLQYHINIVPFGSKIQLIGVALFHHMKPDTTVIFVLPRKYNAEQYTEGSIEMWKIDLGKVQEILSLLDSVGTIKLENFGENNENK